MKLRPQSPRPELVVGPEGQRLVDPAGNFIGVQAVLGRGRMVFALPVDNRPLKPPHVVHGSGYYLGDPDGNLIGKGGVVVSRMLDARWVKDTRRLSG